MTRRRLAALAVIAAVVAVVLLLAIDARERNIGGEPNAEVPLHEKAPFPLGTAVAFPALDDYPGYREELAREFDSVTAENAMKWGVVEPERDEYEWAAADAIVDFARDRKMEVRGHTLVWHNQLPLWLSQRNWTRGQLRPVLREHIRRIVGRYQGRIAEWDVLNEIVADDGSGLRESMWSDVLGAGFPADALRWARAADPEAQLYINEIAAEAPGPKADAYYELVRDLLAEGAPLDGVGFQAHFNLDGVPEGFDDNLRRFAELGVEVRITELDVAIPLPVTDEKLAAQADIYADVVRICRRVDGCSGITAWGFTDRFSWIPATQPDFGAATLLDEQLEPKPAYRAFAEALTASR